MVVLEKSLESPLDGNDINPVHPKGNQPWIIIGRTDAEHEAPILWPCDAKSWLIRKDPDVGKDWRQEEKAMTEDGITDSMDMSLSKLWEMVENREAWHAAANGITKSQTRLSNWTTMTINIPPFILSKYVFIWLHQVLATAYRIFIASWETFHYGAPTLAVEHCFSIWG